MKQVGPNTFIGDDPYWCSLAAELSNEARYRAIQRERDERLSSPSDKFFRLLSKQTTKPKRYGHLVDHPYFRYGDHTLISVCRRQRLSGVPDAKQFMVHLESLYVIDVSRGNGSGSSCMRMLMDIAEEAGCVIDLFCNPFSWSRDGLNAYAMESFDQLWHILFDEEWDILYHNDSQSELTKFFYQTNGMVNMCLYDEWVYGRDKKEDLPFEQQFVFLPSTLSSEFRQQLDERLKKDGCEMCNRN